MLVEGFVNIIKGGLPLVNVYPSDKDGKYILMLGQGTKTDFSGKFSFNVMSTVKYLAFSHVGYTTKVIDLSKQNDLTKLNIELKEGLDLKEFVKIGYLKNHVLIKLLFGIGFISLLILLILAIKNA